MLLFILDGGIGLSTLIFCIYVPTFRSLFDTGLVFLKGLGKFCLPCEDEGRRCFPLSYLYFFFHIIVCLEGMVFSARVREEFV